MSTSQRCREGAAGRGEQGNLLCCQADAIPCWHLLLMPGLAAGIKDVVLERKSQKEAHNCLLLKPHILKGYGAGQDRKLIRYLEMMACSRRQIQSAILTWS